MNQAGIEEVRRIMPVTDEDAARRVSAETLADLATQITALPAGVSPASGGRRGARRPAAARRRLLALGLPAAAMGVAAGVVLALVMTGSQAPPSATGGQSRARGGYQALSFTESSGYITVLVKDPYADPKLYNAEFAQHHLNVTLRVLPVSPTLVGTIVFEDTAQGTSGIAPITAKGRCWTPGGGNDCTIGLKVPLSFQGQATFEFGRPARPGEQYASTTSPFVPGEALHGMHYIIGQKVTTVLAEIAKRHLTAVLNDHVISTGSPSQFPGTWYVQDALPFAPGEVMLFVGRQPGPDHASPPSAVVR